jgi:predicted AAA+ superfamily ATPase
MKIDRPKYLHKLIGKKENGLVKVITGVRRCGKSYLLFNLYKEYLTRDGVPRDQIVELALDEAANAKYRNPLELDQYIRELVSKNNAMHYVFLDEIQKVVEI